MKKEDKNLVIEALGTQLAEYSHFYLVNIEGLDAAKTSELRRACFKQDIKLLVAKNTLLQKALEKKGLVKKEQDTRDKRANCVTITPKGRELYREVGGDRWFVREPVDERHLRPLNTVRDLHQRVPVGRFETFSQAAAYVDGRAR